MNWIMAAPISFIHPIAAAEFNGFFIEHQRNQMKLLFRDLPCELVWDRIFSRSSAKLMQCSFP